MYRPEENIVLIDEHHQFKYCGQSSRWAFSDAQRVAMVKTFEPIATKLAALGYRGHFELNSVLDPHTNRIYHTEINARLGVVSSNEFGWLEQILHLFALSGIAPKTTLQQLQHDCWTFQFEHAVIMGQQQGIVEIPRAWGQSHHWTILPVRYDAEQDTVILHGPHDTAHFYIEWNGQKITFNGEGPAMDELDQRSGFTRIYEKTLQCLK